MTKEEYVSFETAKLLKEKGFNQVTIDSYRANGQLRGEYKSCNYPCPTQQMACRWLREVHNIYIGIQPDFPSDKDYKMCWCWSANILYENCISTKGHQCYIETYEEAVEAAIKYCLENLI